MVKNLRKHCKSNQVADAVYYFKDGRVEGVELEIPFPGGETRIVDYRRWGLKEKRYFAQEASVGEIEVQHTQLPSLVKKVFEANTREGVEAAIDTGKLPRLRERVQLPSLEVLEAKVSPVN